MNKKYKYIYNRVKNIIICLLLSAMAVNVSAKKLQPFVFTSGAYIRVGVGYYADVNIGAGYTFPFRLSVGGELTTWSMFCGKGIVADIRYRFLNKQFSPFISAKAGYALLGQTYDYKTYSGFIYSSMAGLSWRWLDVGAGVAYDSFYGVYPMANISYTFIIKKKEK